MRQAAGFLAALAALMWAGAARAEVRFAQTVVNLGEIRSGARLARQFRFVNRGNHPVEIIEVRPGCGCLRPQLAKLVFGPGEEAAVPVEVNARGESAGPHLWRMAVRFRGAGGEQEITLEVAAKVVTEVTVQPAALTLVTGGPLTHEIVLTDLRARPLAVARLITSSPQLRARLLRHDRDGLGNWVWRFALEVGEGWPEGSHGEMLVIATDDPDYGQIEVPITVVRRARGRVTASPERVTFEVAPGQDTVTRTVRLRHRDGAAVTVESVTADHPALKCECVAGPDGAPVLRITVDRRRMDGPDLECAVRIQIATPVRETVTIPVTCVAQQ